MIEFCSDFDEGNLQHEDGLSKASPFKRSNKLYLLSNYTTAVVYT
jgi:hypothetical protein